MSIRRDEGKKRGSVRDVPFHIQYTWVVGPTVPERNETQVF